MKKGKRRRHRDFSRVSTCHGRNLFFAQRKIRCCTRSPENNVQITGQAAAESTLVSWSHYHQNAGTTECSQHGNPRSLEARRGGVVVLHLEAVEAVVQRRSEAEAEAGLPTRRLRAAESLAAGLVEQLHSIVDSIEHS